MVAKPFRFISLPNIMHEYLNLDLDFEFSLFILLSLNFLTIALGQEYKCFPY